MKKILLSFLLLFIATMSYAQIGYQVSLLNTATGEPRANEKVSCFIQLSNSEGAIICSETKSATSNDFGVISLTVGNAHTFDNMDWNKLPLYVSVSIGGKLIGKSQVLTVPVAEYAKKTGTLTYKNIGEKRVVSHTWYSLDEYDDRVIDIWSFSGGTAQLKIYEKENQREETRIYLGIVRIDGNAVMGYVDGEGGELQRMAFVGHYSPEEDTIYIIRKW